MRGEHIVSSELGERPAIALETPRALPATASAHAVRVLNYHTETTNGGPASLKFATIAEAAVVYPWLEGSLLYIRDFSQRHLPAIRLRFEQIRDFVNVDGEAPDTSTIEELLSLATQLRMVSEFGYAAMLPRLIDKNSAEYHAITAKRPEVDDCLQEMGELLQKHKIETEPVATYKAGIFPPDMRIDRRREELKDRCSEQARHAGVNFVAKRANLEAAPASRADFVGMAQELRTLYGDAGFFDTFGRVFQLFHQKGSKEDLKFATTRWGVDQNLIDTIGKDPRMAWKKTLENCGIADREGLSLHEVLVRLKQKKSTLINRQIFDNPAVAMAALEHWFPFLNFGRLGLVFDNGQSTASWPLQSNGPAAINTTLKPNSAVSVLDLAGLLHETGHVQNALMATDTAAANPNQAYKRNCASNMPGVEIPSQAFETFGTMATLRELQTEGLIDIGSDEAMVEHFRSKLINRNVIYFLRGWAELRLHGLIGEGPEFKFDRRKPDEVLEFLSSRAKHELGLKMTVDEAVIIFMPMFASYPLYYPKYYFDDLPIIEQFDNLLAILQRDGFEGIYQALQPMMREGFGTSARILQLFRDGIREQLGAGGVATKTSQQLEALMAS